MDTLAPPQPQGHPFVSKHVTCTRVQTGPWETGSKTFPLGVATCESSYPVLGDRTKPSRERHTLVLLRWERWNLPAHGSPRSRFFTRQGELPVT